MQIFETENENAGDDALNNYTLQLVGKDLWKYSYNLFERVTIFFIL
jgi:hypothetical protein